MKRTGSFARCRFGSRPHTRRATRAYRFDSFRCAMRWSAIVTGSADPHGRGRRGSSHRLRERCEPSHFAGDAAPERARRPRRDGREPRGDRAADARRECASGDRRRRRRNAPRVRRHPRWWPWLRRGRRASNTCASMDACCCSRSQTLMSHRLGHVQQCRRSQPLRRHLSNRPKGFAAREDVREIKRSL